MSPIENSPLLRGGMTLCLLCCGCAHFHTDMDRAGAYHNKAIMASRRGDYEAAVLLMDSSLAIYDGSPSGWAARAHFEEKLGDDEAALANYSRSIERIEAFPVTRNRYVLSLHADTITRVRRSAKGWETPPGQGRICSRSKSTKRGSSGRSGGRNPTTGSPGNDAAALKMAGKDGILMRCVAPALSGASLILAVLSYSGCASRQPREDPAYVYHREAVNAYMERQYADALSLLERCPCWRLRCCWTEGISSPGPTRGCSRKS